MKFLKIFKKVVLTVIGIAYFAFALCMTFLLLNYNDYGVTQFGETSLVLIQEKVGVTEYEKGDLVVVESQRLEDYKVGETVFTYRVNSKGVASIEVGVIGEVYPEEKAIAFENGDTFAEEFIAGTPKEVHKNVGSYLSVIESQWGFLFIVLVPCFLIFIYEIYALIVEIKYGADEE